jgi:hypothetical protein
MEDKFNFENNDNFNLLLIKPNTISQFNYTETNYLDNIITMNDTYEDILFNSENFIDLLHEQLISKNKEKKELELFTQVILEIPNYIYEIIYMQNLTETDDELNELGTLLNTNGENIYGNILLLKTFIPSLSNSLLIKDTFKEDIKIILNSRANINIVTFNDNEWSNQNIPWSNQNIPWSNQNIPSNLDEFAKTFFEDRYSRCEVPFLLHNINIWYEICEGCSLSSCGKVIEKPIYKCFWFTKINDNYNGNLSLDEVQKIIKLSYKLDFPFKAKDDWLIDETDKFNRKVIKNKYKILDLAYDSLC